MISYHFLKYRVDFSQLTVFIQTRLDANRTAAGVGEIYRHAGISERSQPPGMSMVSLLYV